MIVLGIDGGGTKTHALALNEQGIIIGNGSAGRSNYHQIGIEQTVNVLEDVSRQALKDRQADIVIYCLSDCDTKLDEMRLAEGIQNRKLADRFACYNDSFAALRAGSEHPYGVAVICGTGFNACGIAPDGRQAKLHSLGPLTGDWGGGYTLGESIFGAVYRAAEGRGKPTLLTDRLFQALNVPDLDTLTQHIIDEQILPAQIVALSPLVFEAAQEGDQVAISILERQADEISIAAGAMMTQLDMHHIPVDIVLSGGVIRGQGSYLMNAITEKISVVCPLATVRKLGILPVVGAALLGFDVLGVTAPTLNNQNLHSLPVS